MDASRHRHISDSTLRRLSLYLRALEEFHAERRETVSSALLAEQVGTTAAQVRKDLSAFGSFGTRGLGYPVEALHDHIRRILGLTRTWRAGLIGAGRIGAALFTYPHIRERGFRIVAIFDDDPEKVGVTWDDVSIRAADGLEEGIRELDIELVILAVPARAAQTLAARATSTGVRGILNFAPVRLRLPDDVIVNHVNLTVELEALSHLLGGEAGVRAGDDG